MKNYYCDETLKFMARKALPYEVKLRSGEVRRPTEEEYEKMYSVTYPAMLMLDDLIKSGELHGESRQQLIIDTCAYVSLTMFPYMACDYVYRGIKGIYEMWDDFKDVDDGNSKRLVC